MSKQKFIKSEHKTRFWSNWEGNNAVQFRTDDDIMVWFCTNLGWVPIGNAPTTAVEAEKFAQEMAEGYGYEERSKSYAEHMAGWDEPEDSEEDEYCFL